MFDIPIAIRHRVTTGHQPYVSAEENIAELTVRAIILGLRSIDDCCKYVSGIVHGDDCVSLHPRCSHVDAIAQITEIQGCYNP